MIAPVWAADEKENKSDEEKQKETFKLVDAGPGFGPFWLTENSLGFAYMEYDVRDKYPLNNMVFSRIRYDGELGSIDDFASVPVGNSIMETSAHFVYDSRYRQLGYMTSNANDRFGSAHGLQVGMLHDDVKKPRIYLESPYYLNAGYELLHGVSMSFDKQGFVAAFSGDLYYIPFGDSGSRGSPEVNDLYVRSYLPYFDDSTIGAELLREGKGSKYPIYFTEAELLLYESGDILLYNIKSKSVSLIATVGEGVTGVTMDHRTKQIAVIKQGEIILYDIAGNELDRFATGIFNARNLAWSPDGQYFAFDNIETIFILELNPVIEQTGEAGTPTAKARPSMPDVAVACGSADRVMQIRRSLEAELNSLRGDVDQTRLVGLRRVSAQLRQFANCQSTIIRGGHSIPSQQQLEKELPSIDRSSATIQKQTIVSPTKKTRQDDPTSTTNESTTNTETNEGFKVKKSRKFNKFRDSPDML